MKKSLVFTLLLAVGAFTGASAQYTAKVVSSKERLKEATQTAPVMSLNKASLSTGFALSKANAAGLTANFSCKGLSSEAIVWSENFDKGTTGWTLESTNPSTTMWSTTDPDKTGAHSYTLVDSKSVVSLIVDAYYRRPDETATATSPEIKVPENAQLKFALGGSVNFNTYCNLILKISTDNGTNWSNIWNVNGAGLTPTSWLWRTIQLDLSAYAGKNIKLRWSFEGYMGGFYLDAISLNGVKTIDQINVNTGEKVALVDMSVGAPTSWSWNLPGGTPATSSEQNPVVYYKRDGVYDVSLTVSNASGTDSKTVTGFVKVTGSQPKAIVLPPATFRDFGTRNPMIAPLVPVQYKDNSVNFPTEWTWAFSGIGDRSTDITTRTEENPEVSYSFRGNQNIGLFVSNQHGTSDTTLTVTVAYSGLITNLQPKDQAFTFDLGDGFGSFPGSNKLKISEYAEKFSRPSKPVLVFGANVYFTEAMATELYEQIQSVSVKLCKSENGLPGEVLASESWMVFELDKPSGSSLIPTTFEFSKPIAIDGEFFIVVSGIPDRSDIVNVTMATAKFRNQGNTAYLKSKDVWKAASDYFPAGQNHTSYLMSPLIAHSVMQPLGEVPVKVSNPNGIATFELFSFLGYETPIKSDAAWCTVNRAPNGLTLDTIHVKCEPLPLNVESRTATLTFTDGLSVLDVKVVQSTISGVEVATKEVSSGIKPSVFGDRFTVDIPKECQQVEVFDLTGKRMYQEIMTGTATECIVETAEWAPGIYIINLISGDKNTLLKGIKK